MGRTIAKKKRKTCFVVTRIGAEGSFERYLADQVLNEIIQPALNKPKKNYDTVRIDREGVGGSIIQAIVDALLAADLVIADLTGLKPNAMYELGISHAWNLPVILIALKGEPLPLDIAELDTVFYELPIKRTAINKAIKEIKKRLSSIFRKRQKNLIFERAISVIGKAYSMDGVYDGFKSALNDMNKSLAACKHELEYSDVWNNPGALERLSQRLRETFKTMSDKIHPFQEIVRGPDVELEPSDKYLLFLLDEASEFRNDAVKIDVLFEGRATALKQRQVLSKINGVMVKIKQIAQKLKTRDKSSSY